ncbi:hypothetical protein K488DRAFT_49512 [Vararia minispora EC-137]|uniref:Uncharacterized protein n=1 Tax=Vararia minispora EC-137 TaxID=1314806 RepID=A0ACB8QML5_9AGAM|nr:hypothetical protein K488DRAFT_49512 [Vararia minispora EC-137]
MAVFASWSLLPAELRLSIVDHVDPSSLLALSATSKSTRALCVPRVFKSVNIACFPSLQEFLACVPPSYLTYIREMGVCTSDTPISSRRSLSNICIGTGTPRSDALIRLLSGTPQLERLVLHLSGGLAPKAVPCFSSLEHLTDLSVENCEDEDDAPLSETTVVGIALAIPKLTSLSLTRITRSLQYADDVRSSVIYSSASVPLVFNDLPSSSTDPRTPQSLPTLLTIPTLRHLAIHDTHLGDMRFSSPDLPVRCALESLEIGAYAGAAPADGATWTARILARVAPTLQRLSCGAGLPAGPLAVRLPRLARVQLTPFVSPMQIPPTLAALADGGAQAVDIECLQEDIEDVVDELLAFVNDATDAGRCPFDHVRLHVKDDLGSDALAAPPEKPAALDEECSRCVQRLEGACDRAGVRVSLLGVQLAPVSAGEEGMDWESDDTAVEAYADDKVVLKRTFGIDAETLEEDAWARLEDW